MQTKVRDKRKNNNLRFSFLNASSACTIFYWFQQLKLISHNIKSDLKQLFCRRISTMSTTNESLSYGSSKSIRTPCECTWHGGSHSIVGNCGLLPASVRADFFFLSLFYHQAKTGLIFFLQKKIKAEILFCVLATFSLTFPLYASPLPHSKKTATKFPFEFIRTGNKEKKT